MHSLYPVNYWFYNNLVSVTTKRTKKKPDKQFTLLLLGCPALISAQHERSLAKILLNENDVPEGKLIVPLAEHLFKKLAPGQHYVIDDRIYKKYRVCCSDEGCDPRSTFGNTDIGMIPWTYFKLLFLSFYPTGNFVSNDLLNICLVSLFKFIFLI